MTKPTTERHTLNRGAHTLNGCAHLLNVDAPVREPRYRLVSEWCIGETCWCERDLTADDAITVLLNEFPEMKGKITTIEEALAYNEGVYYLEVDHPYDEEGETGEPWQTT